MMSAANKRRQNVKHMYRREGERNRPNTIVFALTSDQVAEIKKLANIDQFIITQTGAQVKNCSMVGHQLFVYPGSQVDFEAGDFFKQE